MATDTAPLRYRHYHSVEDTPDKIDFEWLTRVANAIIAVVAEASQSDMRPAG